MHKIFSTISRCWGWWWKWLVAPLYGESQGFLLPRLRFVNSKNHFVQDGDDDEEDYDDDDDDDEEEEEDDENCGD